VSSAIHTVHGTESEQSAIARPEPVPLEIPVSVTGAKATGDPTSRDLFSEETATILVFRDGAVIRLAAPVAVGQLLFLTSQKTNQEIVCEVLRKRDAAAGQTFVELQFTEECPGYWGGVAFPAGASIAPAPRISERPPLKPKAAAKPVPSAATLAPIPPPDEDTADQLNVEVEALRKQLFDSEKKKSEQPASVNGSKTKPKTVTEELADVNEPVPLHQTGGERKPELLMPPAQDKSPGPRSVIAMALPTQKHAAHNRAAEAEEHSSEDILPEPELDFSQVSDNASAHTNRAALRAPVLASKIRVMAASAVLASALAAVVWYGKLWQYLPLGKTTQAAAGSPRPIAPRPLASAANGTNVASTANTNPSASRETDSSKQVQPQSNTSTRENVAVTPNETVSSTPPENAPSEKPVDPVNDDAAAAKPQPDPPAPELVHSDAPVSPAKLLKAANPVYPPDAMTNYITGDIKAEVTVDASGHVAEVKVISGPQALRDAAVAALKQYQYAPAAQAGKPVASKATETVKFWFNP
jgi:TonB family protein